MKKKRSINKKQKANTAYLSTQIKIEKYMKSTSLFKSKQSTEAYQIKKNFSCNSRMVVYLIEYLMVYLIDMMQNVYLI